jgi:hypothetical protein
MPSATAIDVSYAKDEKRRLTAYEKILYESKHDVRCKAEEKAGRRIGFYRIRGDIGLGNFSRVKLGVHLLAKGTHQLSFFICYQEKNRPINGRKRDTSCAPYDRLSCSSI